MFFKGKSPISDYCCGCSACQQVCAHNAINMATDDDGFIVPEVNLGKCVDCGLCELVCPIIHTDNALNNNVGECMAAINNNSNELLLSSSGGVFSAIADYILSKKGVIYGASFNEDMKLVHVPIESSSELDKLRGSKYLQSSIGNVYREIRTRLKNGQLVYFTGTGCQVAGLKCFLMRNYDNLICSDILCHGTPNQQVFDFVIKELEEKYQGKVINYKFRDKYINGWGCCSSSANIKINNQIRYIGFDPLMISYYNAFISGCMNREICYKCPFATEKRTGDITLGDFWGVQNYLTIKNRRDGVSAILVNTPKGKEILERIKSDLTLYDTKLENIASINKTLHHPTPKPVSRNTFFSRFKTKPSEALYGFQGDIKKAYLIYNVKKFAQSNVLFKYIYRFILNLKG